jgi:hypothetical protein
MKAIQSAMLDAHLHRVEVEVAMQIRSLFGRCPGLVGFAVQDLAGLSQETEWSDVKPMLFVTDIGFSATVSREQVDEVYTLIGTAISDVVSEQPEAFELLRGRTFARTLH